MIAAIELQLQPPGQHRQLPRPDDGAVISGGRPVGSVDVLEAVSRISDEDADGSQQAGGEGAEDVGGGLVEEGRQLGLVGGVEQEEAEGVVGVHDLDLREVVVALEGEGVEDDVRVDGGGGVGPGEAAAGDVGGDARSGFGGGHGHAEELEGGVFPYLREFIGERDPVAMIGVDAGAGEGCDAAEGGWHEGSVDVVRDPAASDTCGIS